MTIYALISPQSYCHRSLPRWTSLWITAAAFFITVSAAATARPLMPSRLTHWGLSTRHSSVLPPRILFLRGGSAVEEEEDEYDDEEYDSEEESEGEEEEEEQAEAEDEQDESGGVQIEMNVEKYDDPLFPSPMSSLYCSLGVMFLARKVDLFNPTMVKLARTLFIAYLIVHQLVILYVRIQAKTINDRTPIELKNPLSGVLQSQLGGSGSSAGMMKNLASSFLSSKSTVVEYDLKQAQSMQSGLIFSMLFMWFLHFKMGQVQPLLINSVSGLLNLVYSPLFQVYVLGRNLERPFKSLAAMRAEQAALQEEENASDKTEAKAEEADDEVKQVDVAEADEESEEEEAEGAEDDEDEEGKEMEIEAEVGTSDVEETEPTEDEVTQEETAADEIELSELADEEATFEAEDS